MYQKDAPNFGFPVVVSRTRDPLQPYGEAELVRIWSGSYDGDGLAPLDDPAVLAALHLDRLLHAVAPILGREDLFCGWSVSAAHAESPNLLKGDSGQLAAFFAFALGPRRPHLVRPGLLEAGTIWMTGRVTTEGVVIPVRGDDFPIKFHAFLSSEDLIFVALTSQWKELEKSTDKGLVSKVVFCTLREFGQIAQEADVRWPEERRRGRKFCVRLPEGPVRQGLEVFFADIESYANPQPSMNRLRPLLDHGKTRAQSNAQHSVAAASAPAKPAHERDILTASAKNPPPPESSATVASLASTPLPPQIQLAKLTRKLLVEIDAQLRSCEARQEWRGAVPLLQKKAAILSDPAFRADVYARVAWVCAERMGDWDQATRFNELVLAINPRHAAAVEFLLRAHVRSSRWEKLLDMLDRAILEAPKGTELQDIVEVARLATERVALPELLIPYWEHVLEMAECGDDKEVLRESMSRISIFYSEIIALSKESVRRFVLLQLARNRLKVELSVETGCLLMEMVLEHGDVEYVQSCSVWYDLVEKWDFFFEWDRNAAREAFEKFTRFIVAWNTPRGMKTVEYLPELYTSSQPESNWSEAERCMAELGARVEHVLEERAEEQRKRAAEEEQRKRAAEEEQRKRAAEEEQRKRAAEDQRKRAAEEQRKRAAEDQRRKEEEEQRAKAEGEERRRKVQEEHRTRAPKLKEKHLLGHRLTQWQVAQKRLYGFMQPLVSQLIQCPDSSQLILECQQLAEAAYNVVSDPLVNQIVVDWAAWYSSALADVPNHFNWAMTVELLMRMGFWEEASKLVEVSHDQLFLTEDEQIAMQFGRVSELLGLDSRSAQHYCFVLMKSPEHPEARKSLERVLLEFDGNWADGLRREFLKGPAPEQDRA